ncbi:MAG: DUF4234 domain-containing protein [Clostridia bacterium]
MLTTTRGFWKIFFLSIITLGFYGLYYIYRLAKDVNLTCAEDGKNDVGGLGFFILMSIISFGYYAFYWNYRVCDRMAELIIKNGGQPRITGGGWLLWTILGSFILIGPLVAQVKQIHQWNDVNKIYNDKHPELA